MMLLRKKWELLKKQFHRKILFQVNGNPLRKREKHKMREVRQNSIKGYHKFYAKSHNDLEMLIMATPILLLTRVIFN